MNRLFAIPVVISLCLPLILAAESGTPSARPRIEQLDIFEDPGGKITFTDIINDRQGYRFRKSPDPIPNYGFTRSVFWVRFQLRNMTSRDNWILEIAYPHLDSIELHQRRSPDGIWTVKRMGDHLPFTSRELPHRDFLMPLDLPPGSQKTFYLRFQSEGTLQFPLYVLTSEELRQQDRVENLALGLYFGIILVLALYNLVLFFIIRDPSYFYYLLYITGYGIFLLILNGLAFEYLWPDSPRWANRCLPFFIGYAFFWSMQFTRSYLHTANNSPALHRLLGILMIGMGLLMVLSLTADYMINIILSMILAISFSILVLFTGVTCLRKGFRPARYFLIAWFSFLIGVTVYALKGGGFLPANFITEYGLQIGSAVEMSLLSLGLADRMQVMNQEKEAARLRMLELEGLLGETRLTSARLEIELLKQNIQPHFLMNSINATIVWLQEDPRAATRLLAALSDELRTLLSFSSRPLVTISEELELCRAHLGVMSMRHDKLFRLQTRGVSGAETIPPLIFHTLVENGLTHGFSDRETGNFLLEKSEPGDNLVRYTLENDGNSESQRADSTGVGLKYVRSRLEEAYPGRWKLSTEPIAGGFRNILEIELNRDAHSDS